MANGTASGTDGITREASVIGEADSRERLEADIRERADEFERFMCGEGFINMPMILGWLDRQASITERELCGRCSPYATAKDYLDTIDSLTAERDELRDKLADKQHVCDVQRDSFLKLERECRELQDVCGELERTVENLRGD